VALGGLLELSSHTTRYCFAIAEERGLASQVHGHFGAAPRFLIFDADGGSCELVVVPERQGNGGCMPVSLLGGHSFDAVVVGGIGRGAMARLSGMGKQVYLAGAATVQESLELLAAGTLEACDPQGRCEHLGHDHGHRHGIGVGGCSGHDGFGTGRGHDRGGLMGKVGCGGRADRARR